MRGAIGGVQADAGSIMSQVRAAQPTADFGVANYTDQNCPTPYVLDQAITSSTTDVQNALNALRPRTRPATRSRIAVLFDDSSSWATP